MYNLAYNNMNLLTFDILSLFLVQIRIVFRQFYEYRNFDGMIKMFLENLLLCCDLTIDGQLFLREFYV